MQTALFSVNKKRRRFLTNDEVINFSFKRYLLRELFA
jgi:hypothetical protein